VSTTPKRGRLRAGTVYFIRGRATRLSKIGVSCNIDARLLEIQHHSPDRLDLLALIHADDSDWVERMLHQRFNRYRQHGEWFRPGRELLAYMASLATPPDPDNDTDQFAEIRYVAAIYDRLPLIDLVGRGGGRGSRFRASVVDLASR